jgi:hypothetical protein
MRSIYRIELFSFLFGALAGFATGAFDVFILGHPEVPMSQLNLDFIYPAFFQLALYGYLYNTKSFQVKHIFFATTFCILASLAAFGTVFVLVSEENYMPRFAKEFPGSSLTNALVEISLGRLSWSFILMLIAIVVASLLQRQQKVAKS